MKPSEMRLGYLEYYAEVGAGVSAHAPVVSILPLKALWDLRALQGQAGYARSYVETVANNHFRLEARVEDLQSKRHHHALSLIFLNMAELLPETEAGGDIYGRS